MLIPKITSQIKTQIHHGLVKITFIYDFFKHFDYQFSLFITSTAGF